MPAPKSSSTYKMKERQKKRIIKLANSIPELEILNKDPALRFLGGYVVALGRFYREVDRFRNLFIDLPYFSPFIEYLNFIESELEELVSWIDECLDKKRDDEDLQRDITDCVLESFSDSLDCNIYMDENNPKRIPKSVEGILEDVESLCEGLREQIREHGYVLHTVLCEPPQPYRY